MSDSTHVIVQTLEQWAILQIQRVHNIKVTAPLIPLPGDASVRQYYRLRTPLNKSFIVVHSPLEAEKNHAFVTLAKDWLAQGVQTPVIFAVEREQGFFLLEDFGQDTLLDSLQASPNKVHSYYQQAMSLLYRIQSLNPPKDWMFERFDAAFMTREMNLFDEWVIKKLVNPQSNLWQSAAIQGVLSNIIDSALEQPTVIMHRDFHSRNLMPLPNNLGVLDFQDAVVGPITYDMVSLLRDCYIHWPQKKVYQWLNEFTQYIPLLKEVALSKRNRWFDWMGLQRHLKVAGIFIRQWLNNNNAFYLAELPRVFAYILYVTARYVELSSLHLWIKEEILPVMKAYDWWCDCSLSE